MEALENAGSDAEVLDVVDDALDALLADRLRLESDRDLLDLLDRSVTVVARLQAWQARLAARVEAADAAVTVEGTSTRSWLAERRMMAPREAARLIGSGQRLQRFAHVADTVAAGGMLMAQADAITTVLDQLPDDLTGDQMVSAESTMIGLAASHAAPDLRRLTLRLIEIVDPVGAEEREAVFLERERVLAQRNRSVTFTRDHEGSVLIRACLPLVEGEAFRRLVDAHAARVARGVEQADPDEQRIGPAMRRADGLIALIHAHQTDQLAPSQGGDRPRVVVTLDYDMLLRAADEHGLLSGRIVASGDRLDAGTLRRLLCEADVLPMVLGGASGVLDVGRDQRLVTPKIRAALDQRDQGCVFPGCDIPPDACQAHHMVPWWAGGETSIGNLVLVCPHHHGIVEPGHDPTADRWQVRLRERDGVPIVVPPHRVDPTRQPRTHARFTFPPTRPEAA